MTATGGRARPSLAARAWRRRRLLARLALLVLVAIVVLQNAEPTRVDLLFWSLPAVPNLAFFLAGALAGAVGWELGRRALLGR